MTPDALYRDARLRIDDLLRGRPERHALPVPATPRWDVHDVVAHLTGVPEDGPPPSTGPDEEWTASHVAARRDVPVDDLLDRWAAASPGIEAFLAAAPRWPAVFDVGSHEQDLRGAVGEPGERDGDLVRTCVPLLLDGLRVDVPLTVVTEVDAWQCGPPGEQLVLRTTSFEAFRWRMGRRSRAQLAAMDWSGDPDPVLDRLCVFGPAERDVLE